MIFFRQKFISKSFLILVFIVSLVGFYISRFFSSSLRPIQRTGITLSEIIESDTLNEIKSYLDDNSTLVVFDLDNTLVMPRHEIGSEQWFRAILDQKKKEGFSGQQAVQEIVPLYYQINCAIPLYLVEDCIPDLLALLDEQKIPVIALTARSDLFKECTCKQLTNAGLKLPFKGFAGQHIRAEFEVPVEFIDGIIYCGKNDKGHVLFYMLDNIGYVPKKIVVVDDKYHNLAAVERACVERKIPFVGIRYSRLDEHVACFDVLKAEQELKEMFGYSLEESLALALQQYGPMY